MQSSDVPSKSPKVFAESASGTYVRTVPQTTADPAAASFDIGFPPDTFTDESAGGVPPDGRDFNGLFNFLSAWSRWYASGGPVRYDSTFQTSIGGYPLGTIVQSATTTGVEWCSTTENNVTNPDTGGAGWIPILGRRASAAEVLAGTEDLKAISPKGLKDAGGVTLVSSNLNANNGSRVWSDGFKECWGFVTVPGNSTTVVSLPVTHTSWFRISLGQYVQISGISQDNCGITQQNGVASFTLRSTVSSSLQVDWATRGV